MSFEEAYKTKYKKYEGRPMIGSMHLNSDGYGYGARIPTERNRMSLPASVPNHRHPPDTAHFLEGCRSTQIVKVDDRACRRNAEAIMRQTSGEVGFHYLGIDPEPLRLMKKPLREPHVHTIVAKTHDAFYSSINSDKSQNNSISARENARKASARSMPSTGRSIDSRWSNEYSHSSARENPTSHASSDSKREKFAQTLRTLDSSFGSQGRRDLFAASQPTKPMHEMVWVATSNNHAALQSRSWSNKLRRDGC
jgi:hypothetical protein